MASWKLKMEILGHYSQGQLKCAICGYRDVRALSIDHMKGGGSAHRKQLKEQGTLLYSWLKKNRFPEGYRVLCMNCQFITRKWPEWNGEMKSSWPEGNSDGTSNEQ